MAGKELGTKHTCFKCGTKFYDLKKAEPLCPKCGADQRQSPALKAPERRHKAPPKPAREEIKPAVEDEAEELELDDEAGPEDEGDEDDDA